ncbi:hypothetical protein TSH58p_17375 [Azospirillum sp. TSH58]|uniref:hypothetical protein n=1 Tax=Azospirillum sp. TSH58 TaxID=664962 RepID=UPI000D5FE6EF|nr:hypothetical protein [Azospirillum sp. TSH58]AWJ85136.1 hypothetical protein TSH58p_17375 [Azospirillum sp. TSH58]PWC80812.1 hypothetical protein TSH58_00780 [Azospirillum sp. TSH58]
MNTKPLNSDAIGHRTWTDAEYRIITTKGWATVSGKARGFFGVHQDQDTERHVLTHLPTGVSLGGAPDPEAPRRAATAVKNMWDWSFTSYSGQPTPNAMRAIRIVLKSFGLTHPDNAPRWTGPEVVERLAAAGSAGLPSLSTVPAA